MSCRTVLLGPVLLIPGGLFTVADQHHVDADPDPALHFDVDADPTFHSDVDTDPTCHCDADMDPNFQFFFPDPKPLLNLTRIRILPLTFPQIWTLNAPK
jgi:hypothetical protein